MSYGLIYTVPFATQSNIPCVVEIEKKGYTGTSTELTAGSSPFTISIDDDEFLYTPTRFSSAKIEVVGSDYLSSLYSTDYKEYRVTLKRNGLVAWCGFIKPEIYTQDFTSDTFSLEIECISAISVLEFIDYETDSIKFVSFWDIFNKCISAAEGRYNNVLIPHVYATTSDQYLAGENVFKQMKISEQNFFDEDGKPMTLKEVLEEVCKLLNWTCTDWMGSLYFVDIDHQGEYYSYDLSLINKSSVQTNSINIQDIGFAGTGHSLDILSGFNKVTIKCSNYPVGDLVPEEDFKFLSIADNGYTSIINGYVSYKRIFLAGESWNFERFISNSGTIQSVDNEYIKSHSSTANNVLGAYPIKFQVYKNDISSGGTVITPEITSLSLTDAIQIRVYDGTSRLEDTKKVLSIKIPAASYEHGLPYHIMDTDNHYSSGAFAIKGSLKVCLGDEMRIDEEKTLSGFSGDITPVLIASMRIGNFYYGQDINNENDIPQWRESPSDNLRYFLIKFQKSKILEWNAIENTKNIWMPYDSLEGFIIEIRNEPSLTPLTITGDGEFCIYASGNRNDSIFGTTKPSGYILKDFGLQYKKTYDLENSTDENTDRIYENVLEENYINELDEIEMKISSYNNDGACYSKIMIGDNYLTDNLYNSILNKTKRPEDLLITRIINHYSKTRNKLTEIIKNDEAIRPYTILSDNFLVDKKFINAGGEIDVKQESFECIMIQI